MRPWLLFVILCAGWSERSFAYESLLETRSEFHTSHVAGRLGKENESLRFKGDSFITYQLRHNAHQALTISAWIWLSTPKSSFFAVNDMFFHGFVLGLERDQHLPSGKRLMFGVGTGNDWAKARCNLECPGDSWNHLAATVDSRGLITEYFNGRPVVSSPTGKTVSMIPDSPLQVMFGSETGSDHSRELGRLGAFDVYDRALSPQEVLSLFHSKEAPFHQGKQSPLTQLLLLGSGSGGLLLSLFLIGKFIRKKYLQETSTILSTGVTVKLKKRSRIRRKSLY